MFTCNTYMYLKNQRFNHTLRTSIYNMQVLNLHLCVLLV